MDIKTCRFCKKNHRGFGVLCPECVEQLDKKYLVVRNYLDRNSESNLNKVAEEAGVDEKSLLYLVREGRLMLRGGTSAVTCMKCGGQILTGKYCDKCKNDLMRNFESTRSDMAGSSQPAQAKPKAVSESKSKMHILKEQ